MIITIDGPSGTGKSTVAQRLAQALGFEHFDTGAVYRAFTWLVLEKKVKLDDIPAIKKLLAEFSFRIEYSNKVKHYFVGEIDVSELIRGVKVTADVSVVSALKEVRDVLIEIQRFFAKSHDCVFEGRDLGTVVFPNAEIKVFLNASPEVRAQRRLSELMEKNPAEAAGWDRGKMLADIMRRDSYDSNRAIAPLRCPETAFQVDTTDLSIDQVVSQILGYVAQKFPVG